jgi:hypothetical protein
LRSLRGSSALPVVGGGAGGSGVGEPLAGGAGPDDLAGDGEPVEDARAELRVGESLGFRHLGLVAGTGDGRAFFALGADRTVVAVCSPDVMRSNLHLT